MKVQCGTCYERDMMEVLRLKVQEEKKENIGNYRTFKEHSVNT